VSEEPWIEWPGGDCPVPADTLVEVQYRADADPRKGMRIEWPVCAVLLAWYHDGRDDDIVRYKVAQPHSRVVPA